jgi:hypothetical protein
VAETQSRKRTTREPTGGARSPAADQDDGEHAAPVCTVAFCPICLVVTAAQGAAPETVDHLLKAAREFFMAARAVIDVRGDHLAQDGASGPTRLEKIEIA